MPVRDFRMDENDDLAVVGGDFALAGSPGTDSASVAENVRAVQQAIKIRVRLFLREYWLDESQGVDWLGQILIKGANPLVVRELIRAAIAGTPDVTSVIGAQLLVDADRQASISYTVRTIYSANPVDGTITSP